MDRNLSQRQTNSSPFDGIRYVEDGREYWSARDLQRLLGYTEWRKFDEAIERARIACKNVGKNPDLNFVGTDKVTNRGRRGKYTVRDYHLSRYACYLVAMNADSRKAAVAQAQNYFAYKTREAELAEHNQQEQTPAHVVNTLWERRAILFNQNTQIPDGYWCIFREIASECCWLERRGIHLQEDAVPDISVGLLWMKEVRRLALDERCIQQYPHHYPDRRGMQYANIYPNAWLGLFRDWFQSQYLRNDFRPYVQRHALQLPPLSERRQLGQG